MLDAKPARLTQTGTVTISDGRMTINGFEGEGTSCRDVAVLAMVWAIGELQIELESALQRPGGGNSSVD